MINLSAVIEHISNVRDSKSELVNSLGDFLVATIPESSHGVLEVFLNGVGVRDAVSNIGHAMEVKGSNEKSFNEGGNFSVVMRVVGANCSHCEG